MAKNGTIKVHLLQNVPGYGRRGAVIPIPPGLMRNEWFPHRMAEYVTRGKLQELGLAKDANLERDSTFLSSAARKVERDRLKKEKEASEAQQAIELAKLAEADALALKEAEEVAAAALQYKQPAHREDGLTLPDPQEATRLLENLLPPNLDFYRTPITTLAPKKVSPSLSASAVTSIDGVGQTTAVNASIYGSVSTNDIAVNLKAILAEHERGAQIALSPDEISFVKSGDVGEQFDRVKNLGVYEVEIKLGGATEAIRRTIKVNPQE